MEHEQALEAISAALDGELNEAEQAELDAHLAQCPPCRAMAEEFGLLSAALSRQEEVPAHLTARMNAALDAADRKARKKSLWKRYGYLAAALVLVAGIGVPVLGGSFLPRMNDVNMDANEAPNMEAVGGSKPAPDHSDHNSGSFADGDVGNDELISGPGRPEGDVNDSQHGGGTGNEPQQYAVYTQSAFRVTYGYTPDAPCALVITSPEELEGLLSKFLLDDLDFLLGRYGEEFFAQKRLVAVVLEASSGSIQFSVDGLTEYAVQVSGEHPGGAGTCDMAAWLLLAEVDDFFPGEGNLQVQMAV